MSQEMKSRVLSDLVNPVFHSVFSERMMNRLRYNLTKHHRWLQNFNGSLHVMLFVESNFHIIIKLLGSILRCETIIDGSFKGANAAFKLYL